jgi:NfeD-like C-terminal, partner-binding
MLKLFSSQDKTVELQGNPPYVLDLSRLKQGDLLEFRYDTDHRLTSVRKLECLTLGAIAKAESSFQPGEMGKVSWQGSLWQAWCEGDRAITKGQTVFVCAREGLTLFVTAIV